MLFNQATWLLTLSAFRTLASANPAAPNFNQIFAAQEAAAAKAGVKGGNGSSPHGSSAASSFAGHHVGGSALRRHAQIMGNKGRGMQRVNRRESALRRREPASTDKSLDSSSIRVEPQGQASATSHLKARADSQYADQAQATQSSTVPVAQASSQVGDGYWFGASSYYLHTLHDSERYQVLDALKDSGFKVVRIFIASVGANNKVSYLLVRDLKSYVHVADYRFLSLLRAPTVSRLVMSSLTWELMTTPSSTWSISSWSIAKTAA